MSVHTAVLPRGVAPVDFFPSPSFAMTSFLDNATPRQAIRTLLKNTPLKPQVQSHLSGVYTKLLATLGSASLAAYVTSVVRDFQVSPSTASFTAVLGMVLLFAVKMTTDAGTGANARLGMLLAFGAAQGISLAPLFGTLVALELSPVIFNALFGTLLIFGCFSAAVLVAPSRRYLLLGGILSSTLACMFWIGLASRLIGYNGFLGFELILGLFVFSGYVAFDTQLIIEKAERARYLDSTGDAVELFLDFAAIFVRILVMLLQKEERREKRRNQRDRDEM